jgi:hypothetical protein
MSVMQSDLFSTTTKAQNRPSDEAVAVVRERLHRTLALVKSADSMPWTDTLSIIREDNTFRFDKDALQPEEGGALWAEFNAEMDRLYAIMNRSGG